MPRPQPTSKPAALAGAAPRRSDVMCCARIGPLCVRLYPAWLACDAPAAMV